jgi:hypothetical protein
MLGIPRFKNTRTPCAFECSTDNYRFEVFIPQERGLTGPIQSLLRLILLILCEGTACAVVPNSRVQSNRPTAMKTSSRTAPKLTAPAPAPGDNVPENASSKDLPVAELLRRAFYWDAVVTSWTEDVSWIALCSVRYKGQCMAYMPWVRSTVSLAASGAAFRIAT